MASSASELHPKCIATTGDEFDKSIRGDDGPRQDGQRRAESRPNLFRKALFTPDGTTIITHNEDNCLRTFVLPPDLLEDAKEPRCLTEHAIWQASSNIQSYAIYPGFDLQNPATTFVLAGASNVPVTLRNALHYDTVQASYPLIMPTNEEHQPPRSVDFTRDGTHFLVGSDSLLAGFDCSRYGEGPRISHKLRRGRKAPRGLQIFQRKGFVSALGISNEGLLALGTNEREIALYSNEGLGSLISSFELEVDLGSGVSDLKWSPCGKYLLVAERQSNVVQVYDVRNTQRKVSDLTGRYAITPQKMYVDVVPSVNGYEVWGGGTDGVVRMWSNPGEKEEDQMSSAALKMHEAPVASAIWHPAGAVLVTASGARSEKSAFGGDEDEVSGLPAVRDNSLRVWTVEACRVQHPPAIMARTLKYERREAAFKVAARKEAARARASNAAAKTNNKKKSSKRKAAKDGELSYEACHKVLYCAELLEMILLNVYDPRDAFAPKVSAEGNSAKDQKVRKSDSGQQDSEPAVQGRVKAASHDEDEYDEGEARRCMRTLLFSQRVNHMFKGMIDGSTKLQQALWFTELLDTGTANNDDHSSRRNDAKRPRNMTRTNPLFSKSSGCDLKILEIKDDSKYIDCRVSAEIRASSFMRDSKSHAKTWRRMLVAQSNQSVRVLRATASGL
ncbi:hypothetical protein BST61_g11334 [Cercospora zeina]